MPTLRLPTFLRSYTGGLLEIAVKGGTVAESMQDLVKQHPSLRPHLYNEQGSLRPYVNLFVGQDNVKDLQGLDTPLSEDQCLRLIPSIAGGMDG